MYGYVRMVVWEDGGREAPSYPIFLSSPAATLVLCCANFGFRWARTILSVLLAVSEARGWTVTAHS